jgi:hypothetical protein
MQYMFLQVVATKDMSILSCINEKPNPKQSLGDDASGIPCSIEYGS